MTQRSVLNTGCSVRPVDGTNHTYDFNGTDAFLLLLHEVLPPGVIIAESVLHQLNLIEFLTVI